MTFHHQHQATGGKGFGNYARGIGFDLLLYCKQKKYLTQKYLR
jgi:hypothetical protein